MKISMKHFTGVLTITAVMASGVCAVPARSQSPVPVDAVAKRVSLNFQNAPVQTVLKTLFGGVGFNNSIDQNVVGTVTIDVRDVSFPVALRSLLRAANPPLAYDISDNIYHIYVKSVAVPDAVPVSAQAQTAARVVTEGYHGYPLKISSYDAAFIGSLFGRNTMTVPPNLVYPTGGSGSSSTSGSQGGSAGGGQGGFGGGQGNQGGQGGGRGGRGGGRRGGGRRGGG